MRFRDFQILEPRQRASKAAPSRRSSHTCAGDIYTAVCQVKRMAGQLSRTHHPREAATFKRTLFALVLGPLEGNGCPAGASRKPRLCIRTLDQLIVLGRHGLPLSGHLGSLVCLRGTSVFAKV